jgi:hypothetical protein
MVKRKGTCHLCAINEIRSINPRRPTTSEGSVDIIISRLRLGELGSKAWAVETRGTRTCRIVIPVKDIISIGIGRAPLGPNGLINLWNDLSVLENNPIVYRS